MLFHSLFSLDEKFNFAQSVIIYLSNLYLLMSLIRGCKIDPVFHFDLNVKFKPLLMLSHEE